MGQTHEPKDGEKQIQCILAALLPWLDSELMYYVDFIAFMEEPEKTWNDILAKRDAKSAATT